MGNDEEELLQFVQGVEWDKYEDDDDVIDTLKKIQQRVEEMDDGDEEEDDPDRRAKVVVVGDGAVGKTCLFITYATGKFPEEYVPTVFENYTHETTFKNAPFLLHMWDTAGQEDYDRLRPLSYPGTEVVVLCFSLVNESTFESIRMKWNPEINHYLDGIPKILVGTKLDMREQKITDGALTKYEEITTEEGEDLAKEIGAAAYIETSPLTGKNLNEVFEKVIAAALDSRGEEEEEEVVQKKSSKKKSSKSKKSKSEGEKKPRKKKSSRKKDGESSDKKKRRKDETSEERRERRRKRKEAKEAKEGKSSSRKKRSKTEGDKKERKKKSKRKTTDA